MTSLDVIQRQVAGCNLCPELREYCDTVARTKRRSYQDWDYWGRPVPGFGDPRAELVIVGLAPAAHGANRTGRMFTGDRSGDFLYAALHRAGLANQPDSAHRDDGLRLSGVYISAACRCAPPANRPTPQQLDNCRSYLIGELRLLNPRSIVALGSIGWQAALRAIQGATGDRLDRRPPFAHGAKAIIGSIHLFGSYHVSQQNTFTGRLTEPMFDRVLRDAMMAAGLAAHPSGPAARASRR